MGLIINVYRQQDGVDCTNGGVSSKHKQLTVVNIDGPFEPTEDRPAVMMVEHVHGCLSLRPAVRHDDGKNWRLDAGWFMMGGNYGGTSDSRFAHKAEVLLGNSFYGAVAIHDRKEG